MPRRLTVPTAEAGKIDVFVIREEKGLWEEAWRPLQGTYYRDLFAVISKEAFDHALRGWSKPFVTALGLPPQGALRKLPVIARTCEEVLNRCPFHEAKDCFPLGRHLPSCFRPQGLESEAVRDLGYEAIRLWREGVYLVVVKEVV